jgi:hypothetical protein
MIFSCSCPNCGTKKEYLTEESGQLGHCLGCGSQFVLRKQTMKVFRHVAVATVAVMLGMGTVAGRSLWRNYARAQTRARMWEATREHRDAERREKLEKIAADPTVIDDDEKNGQ